MWHGRVGREHVAGSVDVRAMGSQYHPETATPHVLIADPPAARRIACCTEPEHQDVSK